MSRVSSISRNLPYTTHSMAERYDEALRAGHLHQIWEFGFSRAPAGTGRFLTEPRWQSNLWTEAKVDVCGALHKQHDTKKTERELSSPGVLISPVHTGLSLPAMA